MGWKGKNNKGTTNFNGKLAGKNLQILALLETWGALGLGQLRDAGAARLPSFAQRISGRDLPKFIIEQTYRDVLSRWRQWTEAF
jgi:hypothetical protein